MKVNGFDLALMVQGYLAAAIWTMDEDDDPDSWGIGDFAPQARRMAERDCTEFAVNNATDVADAVTRDGYPWDWLGHDLWLTRNGHGAGFWDRKQLQEGDLGDRLSNACRHHESSCYVGDDLRLYLSGADHPFAKPASAAVAG